MRFDVEKTTIPVPLGIGLKGGALRNDSINSQAVDEAWRAGCSGDTEDSVLVDAQLINYAEELRCINTLDERIYWFGRATFRQ